MATVTTTKRNHLTGLMTGFLAVALALLAAGVLWLVVSTSSGSSTEPAPVDRTSVEPSETSKRAVNPNGPGAPASEHSSNWVTGAERAVNPNGPDAPASEHSVDGASK